MPMIMKPIRHNDLKQALAELYHVRSQDVAIDVYSQGDGDKLHIGVTIKLSKGLSVLPDSLR